MSPWLLLIAIGLATFGMRLSSAALAGRYELPPLARAALRFVPPAVLTAIIVPELLLPNGELNLSFSNFRLLAGLLAILVAWRTRSVLLTIGAGLVAYWLLSALANAAR